MDPIVSQVRDFAIKAHEKCEYHGGPFVTHLDKVAAILRDFGYDRVLPQSTAYLHDLLEDTAVSSEELLSFLRRIEGVDNALSVMIVGATKFCTDADGSSRRLRKRATYRRQRNAWIDLIARPALYDEVVIEDGTRVKVADRIANVSSCLDNRPDLVPMYVRERDAFYLALQRPGICDAMWTELERLHDEAEERTC